MRPATRLALKLEPLVAAKAKERQKLSDGRGKKRSDNFPHLKVGKIRDKVGAAVGMSGPTFEDYCREKWGITPRYANLMISGAMRIEAMKTGTVVPILPDRERHIRELCRLESDAEATEVWGRRLDQAVVKKRRP